MPLPPMKVSHERFELPQGWMHYAQVGHQGRPLVCLHGGTGNWTNYRPLIRHLAGDHQIWAPEIRGHGRTPWQEGTTLESIYDDLIRFLATLPRPFVLLSHSFGGYFGVRLAAEHPDWVSHLVVMNSARVIPRSLPFRVLRWITPLCGLLARPEGVISTGSRVTRLLIDEVIPGWDLQPYYPRVRCPSMVILGRLDPLIPLALGRQSAGQLGARRLEVLPWGMHVAMWERPGTIHRWLREFLDQA